MIPDGGPAFPSLQYVYDGGPHVKAVMVGGMTLRDWFAGMAMQAILSTYTSNLRRDDRDESDSGADCASFNRELAVDNGDGLAEVAADAYLFADAMLAERDKNQKEQR